MRNVLLCKLNISVRRLFVLILFVGTFGVVDVEVTKFVGGFVGGDHVKVITELVLLEVLLGEVLEVSLGEGSLGSYYDLGLVASNGY